jgi:hypothetical protein
MSNDRDIDDTGRKMIGAANWSIEHFSYNNFSAIIYLLSITFQPNRIYI